MRTYIIRRLLLVIPTLLIVSVIVFFMVRLIPADIIDVIIMSQNIGGTPEAIEATRVKIEADLGLDVPVLVQLGRWLGVWPQDEGGFSGIFQGDLGMSMYRDLSVAEEIRPRLPISLEIGIIGIVVSVLISFPIGIYSAIRQDSAADYIGRSFAIAMIAIPSFWLGTMVVVFPSIWWRWSPPIFYIPFTEDPMGNLAQFALPGVILGMSMCGLNMRMIRTMMLEVLRQDYIRTAWSKGLRERTVVLRHALKNALIPVVTIVGLQLPILIGGSVVLEAIFNLPGIGRLIVEIINDRDYIMLSGINLTIASFVLVVNLIVDMTYSYLDPRVRYA